MDIASLVADTRARLVKFHGRYPDVAAISTVVDGRTIVLSYSWLTKFAKGRFPNPTMDNLVATNAALTQLEQAETTEQTNHVG